ncbi:MAG: YggS family pyridoxal phosphate-dependent enzyme [Actinobacteria bacterium]|nr:YggS family pyridoxal phosphate-dependent enzyme [Actinomycetota bacterium]
MAAVIGLEGVRERIAAATGRAGRSDEPTLVAVTKTASFAAIEAAMAAGHRDFGENRADRLAECAARFPEARWHMIGRLQGNKVRLARPAAALLHSLDRPSLAGYWARGEGAPPPVLVQVNVSGDPAKAGPPPDGAAALVDVAVARGLEVRGLMTIPPFTADPEAARPHFRALAALRDRLAVRHPGLEELSMGMTDDYEVAVAEGATLLRVGRAIFGPSEEHRG